MISHHATTSLKQTFPIRASEWALSLMLASWGGILLWQDDLFSISPSYHSFAAIMPEAYWGTACLMIGLIRIVFLFVNGLWRRSPHLRFIGSFISCLFWFQITATFVFSGTWSTGLAIYPYLFLLEVHSTLRAATDAAIIDKKFSEQRNGTHA